MAMPPNSLEFHWNPQTLTNIQTFDGWNFQKQCLAPFLRSKLPALHHPRHRPMGFSNSSTQVKGDEKPVRQRLRGC